MRTIGLAPVIACLLLSSFLALHASGGDAKSDVRILFMSEEEPTGWCLMRPDGTDVEPLTSKTRIVLRYPTQDPGTVGEGQSKKVVAVTPGSKTGLSAVTLAENEAAKPRVLVEDANEKTQARLAPGEASVAYLAAGKDGTSRLAVVSAASGAHTPKYVVNSQVKVYAWSPDGKLLAIIGYDGHNNYVSTLRADGTALTRVPGNVLDAHGEILPEHLVWSPDGQSVAFFRQSGGTQLCVAKLTEPPGKESVWLQKFAVETTTIEMSWSPDGKRIAVCWYGVPANDNRLARYPNLGKNEGIFLVEDSDKEPRPFKLVRKDAKQPRFVRIKAVP